MTHIMFFFAAQDSCNIDKHFINKVFNGRVCNTDVTLTNGKVRKRYGRKVLEFFCNKGWQMIGWKYSACVDGDWSHPGPVCACECVIKVIYKCCVSVQLSSKYWFTFGSMAIKAIYFIRTVSSLSEVFAKLQLPNFFLS